MSQPYRHALSNVRLSAYMIYVNLNTTSVLYTRRAQSHRNNLHNLGIIWGELETHARGTHTAVPQQKLGGYSYSGAEIGL